MLRSARPECKGLRDGIAGEFAGKLRYGIFKRHAKLLCDSDGWLLSGDLV